MVQRALEGRPESSRAAGAGSLLGSMLAGVGSLARAVCGPGGAMSERITTCMSYGVDNHGIILTYRWKTSPAYL